MKNTLTLLFAAVQGGVPGLEPGLMENGRHLAAGEFNYKDNNGADWPSLPVAGNECGYEGTQSPIDLSTEVKPKDAYSYLDDNFNKKYYNQKKTTTTGGGVGVPVKYLPKEHTSKTVVNLPDLSEDPGTTSFFYSEFGDFMGGPMTYGANQFHFHAGSEHTIDGVRHDLEMHTVHFPKSPKGGIIAAAMGIMFSTDSYTAELEDDDIAIIDNFFDSLKWEVGGKAVTTDQKSPKVTYGDLMMLVDMRTRWIYRGSVTTPPCATAVYWNVCKTIYPVKAKHLEQFKTQLDRGYEGLRESGNWRLIQPLGDRTVYHLYMDKPQPGNGGAVAVLLIIIIVMCLVCIVGKITNKIIFDMGSKGGKADDTAAGANTATNSAPAANAEPAKPEFDQV
jgi:carbonic anhydrase